MNYDDTLSGTVSSSIEQLECLLRFDLNKLESRTVVAIGQMSRSKISLKRRFFVGLYSRPNTTTKATTNLNLLLESSPD